MKEPKNELDVDFIGGATPLTKKEEQAISEFIKAAKVQEQKRASRQKAQTAKKSIGATGVQ
ncbi:hypothetical protein HRG84_02915 [Flavisolibacter sp. BT320]|nr:hypothetical protein [Flavisolibacter longurius]